MLLVSVLLRLDKIDQGCILSGPVLLEAIDDKIDQRCILSAPVLLQAIDDKIDQRMRAIVRL
jgi:hypothetical protein